MTLAAPFYELGDHIAVELPGARAMFTTRRGGFSAGPYESLNLGRRTGDDASAVERNHAALERAVGAQLVSARQVHGSDVRRVRERPDPAEPPGEADGQATTVSAVAPMALVADCLPIALAGDGVVAMLHAGWRGLAGGVIEEGVRAVRELGSNGALTAAIGPGAGPCCYEVGEETRAALGVQDDRRTVDLKALARGRLERAGVAHVHDVGICTICCEQALFFSHRRDGGVTGRQAGVAWLT